MSPEINAAKTLMQASVSLRRWQLAFASICLVLAVVSGSFVMAVIQGYPIGMKSEPETRAAHMLVRVAIALQRWQFAFIALILVVIIAAIALFAYLNLDTVKTHHKHHTKTPIVRKHTPKKRVHTKHGVHHKGSASVSQQTPTSLPGATVVRQPKPVVHTVVVHKHTTHTVVKRKPARKPSKPQKPASPSSSPTTNAVSQATKTVCKATLKIVCP